MSLKIAFLVVAVLVIFQVLTWEADAFAVKRDVDQGDYQQQLDDAQKKLQEAFQGIQKGLQDLKVQLEHDPLFQNISQSIQAQVQNFTGAGH